MEPITYGLGSCRDLVTMVRDGDRASRVRLAEWSLDEAVGAVNKLINQVITGGSRFCGDG